MCIIVAKEKGKSLPSKKTLKRCFDYNSDGAGFMYVDKGKVVIDKGYMSFTSFYNRLKELKQKYDITNKALVMHFRIGTSGKGAKNLTHPFPLSNKVKELNKIHTKTMLGIAHNGIIHEYEYDDTLSDTQSFIKDFMYPISELSHDFYRRLDIQKILKKECASKLCILDTNENLYYIGEFIEDKGIMYSNGTYKPIHYTYYNYGHNYNYPSTYDDYYDDYYDEYLKWYEDLKKKEEN